MKDLNRMMLLCVISMAAFGCNAAPLNENLSKITLPRGFSISIYAENPPNPRQLALGDQGTVQLSRFLCRQLMRSSPCLAGPARDPASP